MFRFSGVGVGVSNDDDDSVADSASHFCSIFDVSIVSFEMTIIIDQNQKRRRK